MKTRNVFYLLIATAVVAMALAGCEKTKRGPYDCYEEVQPWASDTCSFSWTGHNTIAQTIDYFGKHDYTIMTHSGDTVRFYGWVYFNGPEDDAFYRASLGPHGLTQKWEIGWNTIWLVGHEDHHINPHPQYGSLEVYWDDDFIQNNPWFAQSFDSLLQKKWYVTAIMRAKKKEYLFPRPHCNDYYAGFKMIKLDTVPNL